MPHACAALQVEQHLGLSSSLVAWIDDTADKLETPARKRTHAQAAGLPGVEAGSAQVCCSRSYALSVGHSNM
jgi:hypothetical protein